MASSDGPVKRSREYVDRALGGAVEVVATAYADLPLYWQQRMVPHQWMGEVKFPDMYGRSGFPITHASTGDLQTLVIANSEEEAVEESWKMVRKTIERSIEHYDELRRNNVRQMQHLKDALLWIPE